MNGEKVCKSESDQIVTLGNPTRDKHIPMNDHTGQSQVGGN